jgi:outer membrane lipoprotein LolB
MRRRACTLALASLALAACAPLPPARPDGEGWQGKLGYRLEAADGERAQAGSAQFDLQGSARAGQLQLTSPLGTTLASASWGPQGLSLFDGRDTWTYADLDALGAALGERLGGLPLPLAALFDWLSGRPWAAAEHTARGPDQFEQLGWRVQRDGPRLTLRQQRLTLTLLLARPA